jgi:hypothetical protein
MERFRRDWRDHPVRLLLGLAINGGGMAVLLARLLADV